MFSNCFFGSILTHKQCGPSSVTKSLPRRARSGLGIVECQLTEPGPDLFGPTFHSLMLSAMTFIAVTAAWLRLA